MQATIDIIRSVKGEDNPEEFKPPLRITPNYLLLRAYVLDDELYVMMNGEGWHKLTREHGRYMRFCLNHKDDWTEIDTVQQYDEELVKRLYEYFIRFPNHSIPRNLSDYEEASRTR